MRTAKNTRARRAAILTCLQRQGRASVDDLAQMFETTPQTIRKDLSVLSDEGRVLRFHGGASVLGGTKYLGYDARREVARAEKEKIGRIAASQIPNNAAVFLNSGTTTAAVARNLAHHTGLNIVTDSVSLANYIRGFPGVEVIVPGGIVRRSDGAILGDTAVEFIGQFRADVALIGVAAIGSDGSLFDYDLREASVARAFIKNARNVILAADRSKYGRVAPVCIGHLRQIRTLVIDGKCPEGLQRLCQTNDVGVTEAH